MRIINNRIVSGILFSSCILFLFYSCKQNKSTVHSQNELVLLTVKPVHFTKGWGYEILADQKIYIKQDKVPGVSGERYFLDSNSALIAANMVVEGIKKGKLPIIDTSLLRSAGARF